MSACCFNHLALLLLRGEWKRAASPAQSAACEGPENIKLLRRSQPTGDAAAAAASISQFVSPLRRHQLLIFSSICREYSPAAPSITLNPLPRFSRLSLGLSRRRAAEA